MKKFINILISFFLFFQVTIWSPFFIAHADEMPTHDGLSTQITTDAMQQTSQINPTPPPSSQTSQTTNTGDNTTTTQTNTNTTETTVNNTNDTTTNQTVNAEANTGNNEASRNISIGGDAGVINTGDAVVNTQAQVAAGENTTTISNPSSTGGSASTTTNTGNSLSSTTSSTNTTHTLVNNGNTTTVNQTVNADANTGGNVADRNISIGGNAGVITTGNALVNTNYLVTAGGNVVIIGGDGTNGPGSGASIIRTNTGNNANFLTSTTQTDTTVVTNENRAQILQQCGLSPQDPRVLLIAYSGCSANTGDNTANRNIAYGGDAGVIQTGDAAVSLGLGVSANSNDTAISGSTAGGTTSSPSTVNTGDNTNVTDTSSTTNSTTVNNFNSTQINQTVNATANTGNNTADRNISIGGNAGVITTGNAIVNVTLVAYVGSNTTDINSAPSATLNSTGTGSVLNTGDNFSYTHTQNTNNTTIVNNYNYSIINQYLWLFANTGDNTANRNIGNMSGVINTGNAAVGVNAQIVGNTNTTVINPPPVISTPTPTPHYNVPTPTPLSSTTVVVVVTPTPSQTVQTTSSTNTTSGSNTTLAGYGGGGNDIVTASNNPHVLGETTYKNPCEKPLVLGAQQRKDGELTSASLSQQISLRQILTAVSLLGNLILLGYVLKNKKVVSN